MEFQKSKELREKIATGEYILIDNVCGKSDIWAHFKLLADAETLRPKNFVQCNKCNNFFSYESSKSGTSHLKRHKCVSAATSSSSKMFASYFQRNALSVEKKEKQVILEACVSMCSKDLRPFDIVSGDGFLQLAQSLIKIGSVHGNVSAAEVLPHPTTISRHIAESADELRNKIIPAVNDAVSKGCCAATTDMWTDDFKKISYTAVTAHYFDEQWNLINRLLFTCDFPDERKTGENIRKELRRRFLQIGLTPEAIDKLIFVTDQGANIVNALQPFERLDCTAHVINTILRNVFNMEYLKKSNQVVFETLNASKALVTYLKQSGLVNRLVKTVHQDVETRWNSKLRLLVSIHEQRDEIFEVLAERNEEYRISDLHVNILKYLIDFLQPFHDATEALEREKCITLPFVLLWYRKLLAKCEVQNGDPSFMKELKERTQEFIVSKFSIKMQHKIATFLCPSFRQLRMLNEAEKSEVLNAVRKELADGDEERIFSHESKTNHEINPELRPTKKGKYDFSDWEDEPDGTQHELENEVDVYLKLKSALPSDYEINVWWKNHDKELPKLSEVVQRYLCIPAPTASSERNFSAASLLVQERRTRLKAEIIDATLFLHNNL